MESDNFFDDLSAEIAPLAEYDGYKSFVAENSTCDLVDWARRYVTLGLPPTKPPSSFSSIPGLAPARVPTCGCARDLRVSAGSKTCAYDPHDCGESVKDGQGKLLFVEALFLDAVLSRNGGSADALGDLIVYVGATPGLHLQALITCFPLATMVCIGPKDMCQRIRPFFVPWDGRGARPNSRWIFIQQFATPKLLRNLKRLCGHGGRMIFMSDLRTDDGESVQCSNLIADNIMQARLARAFGADYSMLKFSVPWGAPKFPSLPGVMYYQPLLRDDGTELRLVVTREALRKTVYYDCIDLERRAAYVNQFDRRRSCDDCTHSDFATIGGYLAYVRPLVAHVVMSYIWNKPLYPSLTILGSSGNYEILDTSNRGLMFNLYRDSSWVEGSPKGLVKGDVCLAVSRDVVGFRVVCFFKDYYDIDRSKGVLLSFYKYSKTQCLKMVSSKTGIPIETVEEILSVAPNQTRALNALRPLVRVKDRRVFGVDRISRCVCSLVNGSLLAPVSYLDVGGGDGRRSSVIADQVHVTNLVIREISEGAPVQRVLRGDRVKEYDLVTMIHTLHHAEDPSQLLKETADSVRPGGFLVVVEHDYGGYDRIPIDSLHVIYEELLPQGHLEGAYHPAPWERWKELILEHGFTEVARRAVIEQGSRAMLRELAVAFRLDRQFSA